MKLKLADNFLKSHRQQVMALSAAVIFIAYFGSWNVVLKPRLVAWRDIKQNHRAEIEKTAVLGKIRLKEAKIREQKMLFIASPEPSEMVEALTRIATDSGLTIEAVNPAPVTAEKDFRKLSVVIEARANYHAVGRFLSRLESQPIYFEVKSLHAAPQMDGDNAGELKVTISISALHPIKGLLK